MHDLFEPILDPTGDVDRDADDTLSPRVGSLRGLRAALVDNGKPNAGVLLRELGDHLTAHHGLAGYELHTKGYFGTPVEDELVRRIADGSDVALAAVGD